jgi:phospholipase C
LIIASPWSRGGCVCSQVFDHTSVLQFLEKLLTHKTGKKIEESNITAWRRTVCGDLTSAFQSAIEDKRLWAEFVALKPFVETIHKSKFKKLPSGFHPLTEKEIEQVRRKEVNAVLPLQEPGVRRSSPLPYELIVDGDVNNDKTHFTLRFENQKAQHGNRTAGAPFIVYAITSKGLNVRHYAVAAGDNLEDSWPLETFDKGRYHFRIHGPNGFFREFQGTNTRPAVGIKLAYTQAKQSKYELTGSVQIHVANQAKGKSEVVILDNAYGHPVIHVELAESEHKTLAIDSPGSHGWYDVSLDGSFVFQVALGKRKALRTLQYPFSES